MKTKLILFVLLSMLTTTHAWSQDKSEQIKKKGTWNYTLGLGMNTTSRDTKYAIFLTPNLSIGLIKNYASAKSLKHALQLKFSFYRETLKDVPFYQLDKTNVLESLTLKQVNTHPMLYVGWLSKYMIKEEKLFVQAGAGFNFLFMSTYKRKFSDGTKGTLRVPFPPKDFFFTRPEVSIGVGFIKKIGGLELTFKPTYAYNFTIGKLNLIPTFNSIALDIFIKF